MRQLETLIQTLCPNGVKRYKLKEIAELKRGVVISKDYINEHAGEYPVYSSQTENNGCLGYIDTYAYDGTYLTWTTDGANAGTVFYREGKFNITNVCGLVIVTNPQISVKYLYYILSITAPKYVNRGMGNPKLMSNVMQELQIPLPPLAVQSEIVRVLDKFTLYKSELAAELAARLQQYEYYRDNLFVLFKDAPLYRIGDIIDSLKTGLNPRQSFKLNIKGANCFYITGKNINNNLINTDVKTDLITEETVNLINKRANLCDNILLFASTGTGTVGRMAYVDNYDHTWAVSETLYCIKVNKEILNTKYLMFALYSNQAKKQFVPKISKGSVPHLKVADLLDVKIPLPPLSEQERIVSILDRFDKLCHDIREGLPAEIDLRQKQYEHYRDKLLTFEAKG